jgi:hypothetical protein
MIKKLSLSLSVLSLALLFTFTNCGDDNEPEKAKIGFQAASSTVLEGNSVTVLFSQALPSGAVPDVELTGNASLNADYTFQITAAGIVFTTVNDGIYDPDETIIITLKGFTGNAELGSITVHTVTITETPLVIQFQSNPPTGNRIEGLAQIVAFNQQLPAGITVTYTITGTATQGTDYTLTQNQNGFVITTLKDEIYDPNETVIIELTSVTGNAVLGATKIYTLTITDEDESLPAGLKISLSWEAEDGTAGDVDMDLLVWFESAPGVYTSKGSVWSAEIGTQFESTTIPANETNGKWGLSYVYYSGTSNNLKVNVDFRSYKGNINTTSNRASYTATYTLANVRGDYDVIFDAGTDIIAQSYQKNNANITDLTQITVATTGSRTKPVTIILDEAARKIIEKRALHAAGKGDK